MHDIFEKVWSWIETGEAVKGLFEVAGGALLATYLGSLLRGYAFLARALHGGGVAAYIKSLGKLWAAIRANKLNPRILETSRLLCEIEILHPPPQEPARFDFSDKSDYRHACKEWTDENASWRENQSKHLKRLMAGLKARKARGAGSKMTPEITTTVAEVDGNRHKIERYFEVANYMELDDSDTFLSDVKIRDGFFAPTFLIAGIMTRYKEDWDHIISNYRRQLEVKPPYSRELVELRSFQFNCWLLWGPSIPVCGCRQWTLADEQDDANPWSKGAHDKGGIELAHQYGFGDESNSVDLLIMAGTDPAWRKNIQSTVLIGVESDGSRHVAAAPVDIIGKVKWGPKIAEDKICLAQKAILGGSVTMRKHQNGRVVIEYGRNEAGKKGSSRYYSAYIWAMFLVVDMSTGLPFFGGQAGTHARWQDLLPFFEHGNIADATTYLSLKRALVAKIGAVAAEILAHNPGVELSFACSFDETRCESKLLYPPPEAERISSLLREEVTRNHALKAVRDRFLLPGDSVARDHVQYASCYLPRIVEEFYHELDKSDAAPGSSH